MSRRHSAEKRIVLPDAKYHDKVVAKFINNVMEDGKKAVAEKIVYSAFDILAAKTKQDALTVFGEAIENVKPVLEVKSRRDPLDHCRRSETFGNHHDRKAGQRTA